MRHRIGDIVKIAKTSQFYGRNIYCPKDVEGKIIEINYNQISPVQVMWDNGCDCGFKENDLRLVRRPNEI